MKNAPDYLYWVAQVVSSSFYLHNITTTMTMSAHGFASSIIEWNISPPSTQKTRKKYIYRQPSASSSTVVLAPFTFSGSQKIPHANHNKQHDPQPCPAVCSQSSASSTQVESKCINKRPSVILWDSSDLSPSKKQNTNREHDSDGASSSSSEGQ